MRIVAAALLSLFVLIGLVSPAQAALPSWPNVKSGATGDTVRSAQHLLRHRGYGISADGVIGPDTWQTLVGGSGSGGGGGTYSLPLAKSALPRSAYDDPHHDCPAIDLPVKNVLASAVVAGTAVSAGRRVGTTGNSTGLHLHIAIRISGTSRCPQNFLLALYDGRTPPAPSSLPRTGRFY
ncbi:hypothetical protein [Lentzea sp. NPDC060358]|uniref:hypothetical protein n=1 Tax=Lentzea sp. NPDC060358 TaxID=3347103 RepID=UPI0036541755